MTRQLTEAVARRKGMEALAPYVWASNHANRLLESYAPTEGLFYVIRRPEGWDLFSYRYDEFPEADHTEAWEIYVAPVLAQAWSRKLKKSAKVLENVIGMAPYAFPRGRVSEAGRRGYLVLHGGDTEALTSTSAIEEAFSVVGRCKWELDGHERCQKYDKEAVRQLLGIKEDWKAV